MLPINLNLPLKAVTDRIRSCRAVLWAIETHGRLLIEILGESFGSLLAEGQVMPFEVQLELFRKRLILSREQVVAKDREYRDQKAREVVSRVQRDEQIEQVNSGVVGLRQAFTGIYSDDKLAEFGFARRTPQRPGDLLEQASHLVTRLSDSGLDLTGSRFGDYKLDAPILAEKLVGSVESLELKSDDLVREERMTEAMKLAMDDALAEYNTSFLWIARTVESLCHLAGLDEVARRVRPSSRRPGVTARKFEEPDAPSEGETEDGESTSEAVSEVSPEASPEVSSKAA